MSNSGKKFRAVLFDLDGTLADSLADIAGALNQTLVARGFPTHSLDAYRQMIGEGVEQLVRRALPDDAQELLSDVIVEYRAHYAGCLSENTRAYPGIEGLLAGLKRHAIHMSVLSNKRNDFTVALVKSLFPDIAFVGVRGERAGVARKPSPAVALELAQGMGVSPEECLFVGDTKIDMLTAVAAGMGPVGVRWGFRSEAELWAHGARWVLSHPDELFPLLHIG